MSICPWPCRCIRLAVNHLSKCRIFEIQIGPAEYHTVEDVEVLDLQLELDAFAQWEILCKSEDCLANVFLELRDLDSAICEYERILPLNSDYPLLQYYLGQAKKLKGQQEKARTAYIQFLKLWKDANLDISEVLDARTILVALI